MNYNVMNKEPKEVKRNSERKSGIMKIINSFCDMLMEASAISHDSAKKRTANFTSWLRGTSEGVTDLVIAEDNYVAYDNEERKMKELEEKKTEE